ncbi:MAG TPA: ABC transporter substrate-binding protein [Roseiarcus sp.]|nr:ABC transporter substrate-binding protein [Roseiarcus sp.]
MSTNTKPGGLSRRRFLQVSASGVVTATTLGGTSLRATSAYATPYSEFTWISPRGTLEVLDDYPYWVGKELGYFGDLKTKMEPGPSDGTATVKFVALSQADMGFPSPGVFSFALNNKLDLVSVWNMGAVDVFDFAFRKGQGAKDLKDLQGKTILLGSAAWQAICDPMFAAAGVDPKSVKYLEAGWPTWGTALQGGQGDAALAWEGLRADWEGKGLKFDYWLGLRTSPFPANSFVVRRADVDDPERKAFLEKYLRGWAMGMQFADVNPLAATEAVFKAMPVVKQNLGPALGVESLMQLAGVFKGDMAKRAGWGDHDMTKWTTFFKTLKDIGQLTVDVDVNSVITNAFIGPANTFDKAKVEADAKAYKLSDDVAKVDVETIKKNFFANAIN